MEHAPGSREADTGNGPASQPALRSLPDSTHHHDAHAGPAGPFDPLDQAPPLTETPAVFSDAIAAHAQVRPSTDAGESQHRHARAHREGASADSTDGWHTISPWPPRPGVFVALWPAYLLVGALIAAAPFITARYVDTLIVDGTIRGLLYAFAIGLCVFMPLVRLSQSRSRGPLLESAMDAFSLLLPLQPLIWFAVVRPVDWRMDRVLAIDLHLIIHAALVALVAGITLRHERPGAAPDSTRRTLAMVAILLLQIVPLIAFSLMNAVGLSPPESLRLLSCIGGVIQFAGSPYEPVRPGDWLGVLGLANIVAALWWIGAQYRGSVKLQSGAQTERDRTPHSAL